MHKICYKNTKLMDHDIFFSKFRHLLDNQLRSIAHFLRVFIFSMRKYDLKLIAQRINEMLLDDECILFTDIGHYWNTTIYKSPPPKKKKEIPKYKVTIPFVSTEMDFINLPKLLRSHESHSNMPLVMEENEKIIDAQTAHSLSIWAKQCVKWDRWYHWHCWTTFSFSTAFSL